MAEEGWGAPRSVRGTVKACGHMVGLGQRELCPSCGNVHVHPLPPGEVFFPREGEGLGGQGSSGTGFVALRWRQWQHRRLVEEWEAGCMSGELLHAYALMLIPSKHQLHPQLAGAKEMGALAKVLRGTPIPIVRSGGRICGSLLGNRLPGGSFLADDGTSKCLELMARQRALASLLAASKRCWGSAPSPVSRETGALAEAEPAAAGFLPSACEALPLGSLEERSLLPCHPHSF